MIGGGPARSTRPADRRPAAYRQEATRPQAQAAQPTKELKAEPVEAAPPRRATPIKKRRKSSALWIVVVIITTLALVAAGWLLWNYFKEDTSIHSEIDKTKYQAVFFASGQVYFGKLEEINSQNFRLKNVFYIQSGSQSTGSSEASAETQDTNMKLIKLGDEVHAPEDEMIINRDQVLFFENLKSDGKVVQLIQNHASGKN